MKKTTVLLLALAFAAGSALAQQPTEPKQQPAAGQHHHHHDGQHHQHDSKHHQQRKPAEPTYNADGIDMAIVAAFPSVKSVKATGKWTEVHDAKGKLLGYAVYSKPASDGIKGYNGETPLLIALSPKQVVTGVWLLGNIEGPRYVQMVTDGGLFKQWNGLTVKKAKKHKVDAVAGATFTSNGIIRSLHAALEKL